MNMVMPPMSPRGDGRILKKVIKIVKGIWNLVKGFDKEAGSVDSINDDSSLENIDRITDVFSNFKEQVHQKTVDIENGISEEVCFYIEEIKQLLEQNQPILEKYRIKNTRIKRNIDRVIPHISEIIDQEVSKKVSLDNPECRNIMKMIPGEKKEKALRQFFDDVIDHALDVCCDLFKESTGEIFEEVTDEILGAVEVIQENSKVQSKKLEEISSNDYEKNVKKLMKEAYLVLDECSLVSEILMEV